MEMTCIDATLAMHSYNMHMQTHIHTPNHVWATSLH